MADFGGGLIIPRFASLDYATICDPGSVIQHPPFAIIFDIAHTDPFQMGNFVCYMPGTFEG